MSETNAGYVPGVCNIGGAERAQRRAFGWIGLAVTVVAEAVFLLLRVPAGWRLFLFLPAAAGATGFLQDAMHFCAGFAMRGVYNFGSKVGTTETVEQAEARRADRRKATRIGALSALIGAVVAVAAFFIGR